MQLITYKLNYLALCQLFAWLPSLQGDILPFVFQYQLQKSEQALEEKMSSFFESRKILLG